jgi:hypothetical protein
MMNEEQIHDLRLVNWLAKDDRSRSKFCYAVKDALLTLHGEHAGYYMQEFTREDWDEGSYGGVFSWHKHILECVRIGEASFHRPTNEFHYEDVRGREKYSPGFHDLSKWCDSEKIEGLKDAPKDFVRADGVLALRRLVHAFYGELRGVITKPPRTLYPFVKDRFWWNNWNGLTIRVPESIAVCSGCGRKLTMTLESFECNPERTESGLFGPHPERSPRIECDSSKYAHGYSTECPEGIKDRQGHHQWTDCEQAWKFERRDVAHWARLLLPEYLAWKNGTGPWAAVEQTEAVNA